MIETVLQLDIYWRRAGIAQKKDELHQARHGRNFSRMRDFVIDDPLAAIW
jgi:hypothetical protein